MRFYSYFVLIYFLWNEFNFHLFIALASIYFRYTLKWIMAANEMQWRHFLVKSDIFNVSSHFIEYKIQGKGGKMELTRQLQPNMKSEILEIPTERVNAIRYTCPCVFVRLISIYHFLSVMHTQIRFIERLR